MPDTLADLYSLYLLVLKLYEMFIFAALNRSPADSRRPARSAGDRGCAGSTSILRRRPAMNTRRYCVFSACFWSPHFFEQILVREYFAGVADHRGQQLVLDPREMNLRRRAQQPPRGEIDLQVAGLKDRQLRRSTGPGPHAADATRIRASSSPVLNGLVR